MTISSDGQTEIYIAARGIDPDEFLDRVRAFPVDVLPREAKVQEIMLLDRGASIPQVDCKLVDQLYIDLDRHKCLELGLPVHAVYQVLSSKGKYPPTPEGIRSLEELPVMGDAGQRERFRLGDIAKIKIIQAPMHIAWEYSADGGGSPLDHANDKPQIER